MDCLLWFEIEERTERVDVPQDFLVSKKKNSVLTATAYALVMRGLCISDLTDDRGARTMIATAC